jgi:Polysaccharide biosynthesis protein.
MTNSKNTIFKTTFLFVFVQAYKLLIRILINKFAALFLGVEGIGIIGLFQNAISILQSGCGLGISQSAIRDLSIARATNAQEEVNKVVTITKRVILFTGIFGVIVTLGLAYPLSLWSFGSSDYTLSFIVLSLAVGIGIIAEGQLGILKGLRKMLFLAKADLLGSTAALLISIFLYYTLRLNGIIPALLVFFVSSYLFSAYFLTK